MGNTEEVTFCAEIYILYTYNLIKKDIDISEYQTRYKLMHCSTGRLGNNNAILCIRVWIMNDL